MWCFRQNESTSASPSGKRSAEAADIIRLSDIANPVAAAEPHDFRVDRAPELVDISREFVSPFQLSRPTIRDDVTLLEQVFLVDTLPPGTATV